MVWFEKGNGWGARASWLDEAGNRHRKAKTWFKLKKDAIEWERKYIAEHANRPVDADTMTVKQLLAAYIAACKMRGRAPNTIRGYTDCAAHINSVIGDVPVCKLNRMHVESAYVKIIESAKESGKELKSATIAYQNRVLKAACNYAIESGIMKSNPCNKAILPQETKPFNASVLKADRARTVLDVLPDYDYQLYIVVLLCVIYGLRRGEALGLRWVDINFNQNTITISGQYTHGEGGKPVWTPLLKTSKSHRTLYLVPYIKDILGQVRDAFPKDRIVQYICELDGKLPSPNAITKRWQKFRETHGYDGIRVHDLRHSAAMMMINNGADLNTVKNMLGHTKIETTQRYLHEDFDTAAAATQKVVAGLFPTSNKSEQQAK